MVMSILVNMSMLQLFRGWLAYTHNFHIEMQFIARQRVIEIQGHIIAFNPIYARVAGLSGIIPDA